MEKRDKLREKLYIYLDDYFEEAYNNLLDDSEYSAKRMEEILQKNLSGRELKAEKKRIKILEQALYEKKGLHEVEIELKKNGLRALYLRNYLELILYFCFRNNDVSDAEEIGVDEYREIKQNCDEICKPILEGKGLKQELFPEKVTVADLKTYIKDNSDENRDVDEKSITAYYTEIYTEQIRKIVETTDSVVDFGTVTMDISKIICKNRSYYTVLSEKCRYYFVKYLYFFLTSYINEFIRVLREMVDCEEKEFFQRYHYAHQVQENEFWYDWTIKGRINKNLEGISEEEFDKVAVWNIVTDAFSLFKSTPVAGSKENISPLFCDKEGKPIAIKDFFEARKKGRSLGYHKVLFLPSERREEFNYDTEKHAEVKRMIIELKMSNFFDYPISINEVASVIFEDAVGLKRKGTVGSGTDVRGLEKAFRYILKGEADIPRSTFLYFLMLMNHMIDWELVEKHERLTEERIDDILSKCGFAPLEDNSFDFHIRKSLKMDRRRFFDEFVELLLKEYEKETGAKLMTYTFDNTNLKETEKRFDTTINKKSESLRKGRR